MANAPSLNLMDKAEREKHEAAEPMACAVASAPDAKAQLENLQRIERTTGRSGAVPRTPKQIMLDSAKEFKDANPSRHFRWVNVGNTDKAMNSTLNRYKQFKDPKSGDAIQRGNLQLWSCPVEMFDERDAERKAQTAAALDTDSEGRQAGAAEFYQEVEKVSGLVKSRGHRVTSPSRLVVDGSNPNLNVGG